MNMSVGNSLSSSFAVTRTYEKAPSALDEG
jgi:hypothetical protein